MIMGITGLYTLEIVVAWTLIEKDPPTALLIKAGIILVILETWVVLVARYLKVAHRPSFFVLLSATVVGLVPLFVRVSVPVGVVAKMTAFWFFGLGQLWDVCRTRSRSSALRTWAVRAVIAVYVVAISVWGRGQLAGNRKDFKEELESLAVGGLWLGFLSWSYEEFNPISAPSLLTAA